MPVTSSQWVKSRGGLEFFEFTDSTGTVHERRVRLRNQTQAEFMADQTPVIDRTLWEGEIAQALRKAREGENPDKVPPDHQTQAEFDRRLLAELMQNRDIRTLHSAVPFWEAHQSRSGNNNNARSQTLGVPFAEYQDVADRMGDMQGVVGGVNNVFSKTWGDIPSGAWT